MFKSYLAELVDRFRPQDRVTVLTGAGVSLASRVPLDCGGLIGRKVSRHQRLSPMAHCSSGIGTPSGNSVYERSLQIWPTRQSQLGI